MTAERGVALILVLAVVLAWGRLGWWHARSGVRARWWRVAALAGAQPVCAALLFLALFPPPAARGDAGLVVATEGAPRIVVLRPGEQLVALPEAGPIAGAERAPDLATALRRHGEASRLRIVGGGLAARDREVAADVALHYEPGPEPRGLVGLYPPAPVVPGAAFTVGARVAGGAAARVDLLDPAGRVVDTARPAADGSVLLGGTARTPGAALFTLRVRGTGLEEDAGVPVVTEAPPATRLLILAGAPGPEVKFLRRWATDAGIVTGLRIAAGGGVRLGEASLDPGTLARTDVAIFDMRAWSALSSAERQAVAAAVRGGMGAVLRVDGAVTGSVRADWRALSLDLAGGEAVAPVALAPAAPGGAALEARRGPGIAESSMASAGERGELPALTRRIVVAGNATPLVRDGRGAALALWRQSGRGRAGAWLVEDSFALVTAGHGDRYGELWSALLSTVARPVDRRTARLPSLPRAGERLTACAVTGRDAVVDPAGRTTALLVDTGGCAGIWPERAGWYRLTGAGGLDQLFYVQPRQALTRLRAEERRRATMALAGGEASRTIGRAGVVAKTSSWPWIALWLAAAALLWWFERSRLGRRST
ncbi:hypothetical protein GCM10011380_27190 [Sphingomonas metalli]|uniref:Carboxypeptidase regulatory-like domain-containing protein n=1 Tax=Sphingomonas metalli TaxID=1779358 RepID=A0A916T955_9SPHN|nr:carboxypeptidase regulatory-like domain-containing protein [Sphingomonas metalli]GGB36359.1 hypothetical protein GCM10011380_27190 [Sphingomonas metalli]